MRPQLHRPYLLAAAGFLLWGGLPLGILMLAFLAGWTSGRGWAHHLSGHAHYQIYGFLTLFIMGFGWQMLAQEAHPRLRWPSRLALGLFGLGTLLRPWAPVAHFPGYLPIGLQILGALIFFVKIGWRRSAQPPELFLRAASVWLLVSLPLADHLAWRVALWGFAVQFVLGMSLRLIPPLLHRRSPSADVQLAALTLYNLGLVLGPGFRLAAVALLVWALGLYARGSWQGVEPFLRVAYGWLLLAGLGELLGRPELDSIIRHAVATGFLLTMMAGMAWRLLPALQRRPPRRSWGRAHLWLVGWTLATALRLMLGAVGGVLQVLALFWLAAWLATDR